MFRNSMLVLVLLLGSLVAPGNAYAQLTPPAGSAGAGNSPIPRFNFVAVTYGETAVLDTSVTDAVKNLLAGTTPSVELPDATNNPPANGSTTSSSAGRRTRPFWSRA